MGSQAVPAVTKYHKCSQYERMGSQAMPAVTKYHKYSQYYVNEWGVKLCMLQPNITNVHNMWREIHILNLQMYFVTEKLLSPKRIGVISVDNV